MFHSSVYPEESKTPIEVIMQYRKELHEVIDKLEPVEVSYPELTDEEYDDYTAKLEDSLSDSLDYASQGLRSKTVVEVNKAKSYAFNLGLNIDTVANDLFDRMHRAAVVNIMNDYFINQNNPDYSFDSYNFGIHLNALGLAEKHVRFIAYAHEFKEKYIRKDILNEK